MGGHRDSRSARVARWRRLYWERVERIRSDTDQIAAAADHLRIALNKCATPEQRTDIIATAVADLIAPAEELLTRYERKGR
ncbi:hypothetical protein [Prauserella muralis]|uniref:Uncharacterized protein n=1 Tax=Prauserella muralis TaxID=588067 RepID=A0A2V4AEY5_9PSEU|nr:hypothetical protein [Prauserella muralis]PXY16567.1 hypothetical protein BAY60_35815 [Prauserella muralis]TWE11193.1 hypothetical protein FHX69_7412 [Prauserella muralis]